MDGFAVDVLELWLVDDCLEQTDNTESLARMGMSMKMVTNVGSEGGSARVICLPTRKVFLVSWVLKAVRVWVRRRWRLYEL